METAANKTGSSVRYPRAQSKRPRVDFTSSARVVADQGHALPAAPARNAMLVDARRYNCKRVRAGLSAERAS